MLRNAFIAALVCACFVMSAAQARPRHSNLQGNVAGCSQPDMRPCETGRATPSRRAALMNLAAILVIVVSA
jgi:hypothetical protein